MQDVPGPGKKGERPHFLWAASKSFTVTPQQPPEQRSGVRSGEDIPDVTCPDCARLQTRIRELEGQVTQQRDFPPAPSQGQVWQKKPESERQKGARSSRGQAGH